VTGWWCRLCDTPVPEPLWLGTLVPVPYHLYGQSRHAVGPVPVPVPTQPVVIRDHGRFITREPQGDPMNDPTPDEHRTEA
jgi:hypothetical protein